MTHYAYGERARLAGELGEKSAKEIFGLGEPEVEIKTMCNKNYRVVIRLGQLEKQPGVDHLIVIYDRGSRRAHGKKRKYERSIGEAFKDKPLEFVFVNGVELCKLISREKLRAEFVVNPNSAGGAGHFACYVPVRLLKDYTPAEFKGHRVYNGQKYIEAAEVPF